MPDEAFDARELGLAIRRLRRSRDMTQGELASWLNVSRQTVVSLEQGGPVAVTVVMRAVGLLGAKVVVAPKDSLLVERAVR